MNTGKALIEYYVDEYSLIPDNFATFDAAARVASMLTEEGFKYQDDFWIQEINYKENGRQVVTFQFKDEQRAMLIKLKGLSII